MIISKLKIDYNQFYEILSYIFNIQENKKP